VQSRDIVGIGHLLPAMAMGDKSRPGVSASGRGAKRRLWGIVWQLLANLWVIAESCQAMLIKSMG